MGMQFERAEQCLKFIREKTDFKPLVALVLGSGMGEFASLVEIKCSISYHDIPGFPVSTVAGHKGQFLFGYIGEVPVVLMQGRVHYYEGYSMEDVVLPARLMYKMGAKVLFLTNAAGGIMDGMKPGDLMMITDHISSFIPSPLIGPNEEQFGTRFPDMSEVYDKSLQKVIRETAVVNEIPLKEGVYLQFTGPQYETPAEIRMAKILGADACGMSTVCEAVAANHLSMKICGISCITNLASGLSDTPLSHEEVGVIAAKASKNMNRLVYQSIEKMGKLYDQTL